MKAWMVAIQGAMMGALVTTSLHAETITFRADSWCPYNCDPKAANPGILIEMLHEAFKSKNVTIDYQIQPWTQAVADVRTGRFNGLVGLAAADGVGIAHTKKGQMITITCAYGQESSKASVKKAADLRKLKNIGVAKDYSYGEITDKVLTDRAMKSKVSPVGGEEPLVTNIRRVMEGKIEALLEDQNVMTYQIRERGIKGIKMLGCTEDRGDIWTGFTASNPKSREWVETLEKGQAELEKSGKMLEIYKKYGIQPL